MTCSSPRCCFLQTLHLPSLLAVTALVAVPAAASGAAGLRAELASALRTNEQLTQDLLRQREHARRLSSELAAARREVEQLRNAGARRSAQERRFRSDQRWQVDQAVSEALRQRDAEHDAALAALQLKQRRELDAARIEERQRRSELADEQQTVQQQFVVNCAELHERALADQETFLRAEFDREKAELLKQHEKKLRAVGKESGWEQEFDRELRAQVREQLELQLGEQRERNKAKIRGRDADMDRRIRRLEDDAERDCDSRLAIQKEEDAQAHRRQLEQERQKAEQLVVSARTEERQTCLRGLETALRRCSEGASVDEVRSELRSGSIGQ
ncbi:MAG: hypothetical protein AAF533_01910 [Acidobacteriota bacterium]